MSEEKKAVPAEDHDKKFSDVTKPGKTPAEPTARPVIVANRSIVKDSTLKHQEAKDAEFSDEKPAHDKHSHTSSEAKPISPFSKDLKKEDKEFDEADESSKADDEQSKDNDQIDPGRSDEKKQSELSESEQARQAELEKLIDSGKYAVPIGHIKRNRRLRKVVIPAGLVLLLLAAVYAWIMFMK